MKRFLEVLILLPLAVIGIALAVANRHAVTVSFDPFTSTTAGAIEAPLFVILIAAIIVGVLLGGFFTWLSQGKHRRALRESRAEAARLRGQMGHS
ncbi:MAG: LapA family protein [Methylovirgula sp.]|nr:LapA family protein [Methylovirgula sp.]